jgi:Ca-activated chloride channel family protein
VKEITSLGLKYNLLTQYTSFIAVREEVRNPLGEAHDVKQPLPLPLGVSDLAIGEGTEAESEPELVWLITALLTLGLIMLIRSRRRVVRT